MLKHQLWDCNQCGSCCKNMKSIGISELDVIRLFGKWGFTASKEKLVRAVTTHSSKYLSSLPHLRNTPIVVGYDLLTTEYGTCPFLCNNKCLAYSRRPWICRVYPFLFTSEFNRSLVTFSLTVESGCPVIPSLHDKLAHVWLPIKMLDDLMDGLMEITMIHGLITSIMRSGFKWEKPMGVIEAFARLQAQRSNQKRVSLRAIYEVFLHALSFMRQTSLYHTIKNNFFVCQDPIFRFAVEKVGVPDLKDMSDVIEVVFPGVR